MSYMIFEDTDVFYNSIIVVCDKDIPVKKAEGIRAGYGVRGVHESGGLVIDNLDLVRHFFQGVRDVFGSTNSTQCDEYERATITQFIWNHISRKKIIKETELYGGMNADQHHGVAGVDEVLNSCFSDFLDYLEANDEEEYKRQLKLVDEARERHEAEEESWKNYFANKKKKEGK